MWTTAAVKRWASKIKAKFGQWPNLIVRLDIWHFMRRLAVGCTTDAHQLYPTFMARMSACIFEWDATDVAELRRAKKAQLLQEGWPALSDQELDKHITQDELALHCRRRTRGQETSIQLLDQLLTELMSGKGNDALGVPLLDTVRMQHIWRIQRRHVRCIQDPPGLALYTETGSTRKGGVVLKTFRCARGSTSMESFHCHLNRFIPGNSANLLNYQIYLLEGLSRCNQDRAAAAVTSEPSTLRTYTGELVHCVNSNYEKVFGRKLVPGFSPPAKYTGELIGVQYFLRQNNEPLQDMHPNSEETSQLMEDLDVEEPKDPDEGFEDFLGSEATIADLMVSNPIKEIYPPPAVLYYKKIRQLVLCNGTLMQQTTLQLVVVNQTTLMQWYNQRLKGKEVSVLLQGVQLPVARPVAADPLPFAKTKPISLPQYQHQPPAYQLHTYNMPANTAGHAKPRLR
ncbi:uncharacterized protein [Takifugu rubripes]|uniref:uncharacterized protein n=1 Tax=Takifugu rubripes TaxID=31033 RepID=UPI001145D166|nr:uncharacterized protein LOC115248825 [Takifugu rubripes]